jgi:hypothetical protein
MTRILSEGFEMRDIVGWTISGTNNFSASTVQKRSGGASLRAGSGLADNGTLYYSLSSDVAEGYFRFGIFIVQETQSAQDDIQARWYYNGTLLGGIYFRSTNVISLMDSTTAILKTGNQVLALNTWYLIEVHFIINDAGGVEIKIDGIIQPELTYSGDTKPGAQPGVNQVGFYVSCHTANNTDYYADDVAVNDTNGSIDNSWCGDGHILAIVPNGTITNQLVGSDGDSVNNHLLVDDLPSNSDTDYVQGNVVNQEDLYDFAATGLASTCTINRVWTESRSKNTIANGRKIALVTKASGGSEVVGSDVVLAPTYTIRCLGTEQTQNPVGPANWTVADIDALQAGVRTRS